MTKRKEKAIKKLASVSPTMRALAPIKGFKTSERTREKIFYESIKNGLDFWETADLIQQLGTISIYTLIIEYEDRKMRKKLI